MQAHVDVQMVKRKMASATGTSQKFALCKTVLLPDGPQHCRAVSNHLKNMFELVLLDKTPRRARCALPARSEQLHSRSAMGV